MGGECIPVVLCHLICGNLTAAAGKEARGNFPGNPWRTPRSGTSSLGWGSEEARRQALQRKLEAGSSEEAEVFPVSDLALCGAYSSERGGEKRSQRETHGLQQPGELKIITRSRKFDLWVLWE